MQFIVLTQQKIRTWVMRGLTRSWVVRGRDAERLRPIAGQISEALRVVQSIEGTLLTAGHLGTINGRKADHDRRRALYEIARAQAKASLIAQALQTARSIGLAGEILGSGLGVEPLSVPGSTQAKM